MGRKVGCVSLPSLRVQPHVEFVICVFSPLTCLLDIISHVSPPPPPRRTQLSVIWLNMSRPPSNTPPTLHPCNVNKFMRYSTGLLPVAEEKLKILHLNKDNKTYSVKMLHDNLKPWIQNPHTEVWRKHPFLGIISFSLMYYWITIDSAFIIHWLVV